MPRRKVRIGLTSPRMYFQHQYSFAVERLQGAPKVTKQVCTSIQVQVCCSIYNSSCCRSVWRRKSVSLYVRSNHVEGSRACATPPRCDGLSLWHGGMKFAAVYDGSLCFVHRQYHTSTHLLSVRLVWYQITHKRQAQLFRFSAITLALFTYTCRYIPALCSSTDTPLFTKRLDTVDTGCQRVGRLSCFV